RALEELPGRPVGVGVQRHELDGDCLLVGLALAVIDDAHAAATEHAAQAILLAHHQLALARGARVLSDRGLEVDLRVAERAGQGNGQAEVPPRLSYRIYRRSGEQRPEPHTSGPAQSSSVRQTPQTPAMHAAPPVQSSAVVQWVTGSQLDPALPMAP